MELIIIPCKELKFDENIINTISHYICKNETTKYLSNKLIIIEYFNQDKIDEYIDKISLTINIDKSEIKSLKDNISNKILGIPMILYMICSLGIKEKIKSKEELYYKIFNVEGYLLNSNHNSTNVNIINNREILIEIPKHIAFNMYKNNELVVGNKIIEKIIEKLYTKNKTVNELPNETIYKLFGIACYYKEIEKNEGKTEFIHKSLYEYFLAEYIYDITKKILNNNELDAEQTIKIIYDTFKWEHIIKYGNETYNYLKYLLEKHNIKETIKENNNLIQHIDTIFENNFLKKNNNDRNNIYDTINLITINYMGLLYTIYYDPKYNKEKLNKIINNSKYYKNYINIIRKNEFPNVYLSGAYLSGAIFSYDNIAYIEKIKHPHIKSCYVINYVISLYTRKSPVFTASPTTHCNTPPSSMALFSSGSNCITTHNDGVISGVQC